MLKLCDFGFARVVGAGQELTEYVATRWYRPPELLLRRARYDASIDVWAAACIFGEMIDSQPLFPGEDDMDMLCHVRRSLGELTLEQQEWLSKDPRYLGLKLPEIARLQTIEKRYAGKIDRQAIDLLKSMLVLEPAERISATRALAHPFFHPLHKATHT